MENKRPGILLVGAGGYGRWYMDYIFKHDIGADLVGICDIDPQLGEHFPEIAAHHVPIYPSIEAFYRENRADLAVLVSPVHFHTDMTLTCLAHGSNVLCEKPLCLTVEEAQRMKEATEKAGRFLSVGYQIDYRRDILAMKADIIAGRFGKPVRMAVYHGFRRGAKYYARNDWAGHITAHGREVFDSPFTNACAHHFQMLTFLLGQSMRTACDVESVEAELYRANRTIENYDIAALRFHMAGGVPVLYYTAHPIRTECWGPVGVLEFEKATITYRYEKPEFHVRMKDGAEFDYSQIQPGGDMQKLLDAVEAVRTGEPPICGIEADLPHIEAVRMVQNNPIRLVREELIDHVELNGDHFLCVRDLEKTLEACAKEGKLPSEMGIDLG